MMRPDSGFRFLPIIALWTMIQQFSLLALPVKTPKWNILLITIDTWRWDRVSVLDSRYVKTPKIDSFARQSQIFTRAFAHNPVTLPSHVNIMTGTTPLFHGISDNSGFRLEDRFLTLAEHLRLQGMATAAFIGAFPLTSRFGLDQGFDLYDENFASHGNSDFFYSERRADKVIAPARDWIARQTRPWFVWIHLFDPHQPYLPPSPFREQYRKDLYSGEVAFVDSQLGIFFEFLDKRGELGKTVTVLTGDHGEALGEKGELTHSYFAYDNTIRVPLFIRIPGMSGRTHGVNVCHVDIFPTLCDLLGFPRPAFLQGRSLSPLFHGRALEARPIYFESLTAWLNRDWAPLRGMIDGETKFIDLPIREVYNLVEDPGEERNLADHSDIGRAKNSLIRLMRLLRSGQAVTRSGRLDADTRRRLQSMGYVSENRPQPSSRPYSEKDDLKILLPLQNKLLRAIGIYQNGDVRMAVSQIREVISQSPSFILAYTHLASILKETGHVEEASRLLYEGLTVNSNHPFLLSKLGIILAESGRPEDAIRLLESCVRQIACDPENYNYLGIAYYRAGNFDQAMENYRLALTLDPRSAPVFNNIGSLYLSLSLKRNDRNAFAQAIGYFEKALSIDPLLASAHNGLGAAYDSCGHSDDAIRHWLKALSIKPDFEMPMLNLGIAYQKKGDRSRALTYFSEYKRRFYPRLPESEKKRIDRLILEVK